jgi:hypothetical protein
MLGGFGSCTYRINDERGEDGLSGAVLFGAGYTGNDVLSPVSVGCGRG